MTFIKSRPTTRLAYLLILATFLGITACSQENNVPKVTQAEFKVQPLDPAEEKRLIEMAQNQKTSDGATVAQVLSHAEKMRPQKFKLVGFELFYEQNGKPSGVGVCYWIGSKRLEGDQYCDISFKISADHQSLTAEAGTASHEEQAELTVTHLMKGRDDFLSFMDKQYEMNCVGFDKKKSC